MTDASPMPPSHPVIPPRRIGVLLVNLGTPDATDYWSMRRYLKEFLSDRRVIEENPIKWWLILNLIILTVRAGPQGQGLRQDLEQGEATSPSSRPSRARSPTSSPQASPASRASCVDWAMRYGNPSIASKLDVLQKAGCDRILIVPLYPQYAAATTATVCDKAFDALATMRWQPALRVAPAWFDEPVYIDALANSLQAGLAKLSFKPDLIIASFHGMPEEYLTKGDPYHCQCAKTTRLLREKLGLGDRLMLTFQSRFGTAEWLKPYTIDTVQALPGKGVKNLAVITPGFTADCLETLGRDRHGERPRLQTGRRREFRAHSLPQRFRRRHGGDPRRGPARAQRLDLRLFMLPKAPSTSR